MDFFVNLTSPVRKLEESNEVFDKNSLMGT